MKCSKNVFKSIEAAAKGLPGRVIEADKESDTYLMLNLSGRADVFKCWCWLVLKDSPFFATLFRLKFTLTNLNWEEGLKS